MPRRFKKVPLTIFQRFFRTKTLGGLVLLGFGLAALAIANSPFSDAYNHFWEMTLTVGIAPHEISLSLHEWISRFSGLEHALHHFPAFVVMPLFAFANAGVKIDLPLQHAEIGLGILAGLLFGKPLGIMMAALIAVKTGIARLPQAVNWRSLLGYGFLAGIGFTMSLFIAMLAFDDAALVYAAKRGISAASLFAGVAGALMLWAGRPLRDVN